MNSNQGETIWTKIFQSFKSIISPSSSNPELRSDSDFNKDIILMSDIRTSDTEPDYSFQKQKDQIIATSKNLLDFLEKDDFENEDLNKFVNYLNDEKIVSDKYKFKTFLHLLAKISENHFRNKYFNDKITQILYKLSDEITKYFSNFTIWNIFKDNLLILSKLLDKKIITFDESIINRLFNETYKKKYLAYFEQTKSFFFKKRNVCENDQHICQLIREDLIEEFIAYVAKANIQLDSSINDSIFETNRFLYIRENISLIQYAAFYGSIRIFKYLITQGVELNESLWLFAIHSNKLEMFHILEENHVTRARINIMLFESIKCFHINIMNYIYETMETNDIDRKSICFSILENYNFIDLFDSISEKAAQNGQKLYLLNDYENIFSMYDYLTVIDFLAKKNNDSYLPDIVSFYFL